VGTHRAGVMRKSPLKLPYIAQDLRPLAVPINSVKPDPGNARQHPERNLETIKASLERYGQRKPIVVNRKTKTIEAGNGTWEMAKALGWPKIAVVFVEDDSTTAVGYGIADNRTAELAEWDEQVLVNLLKSLGSEREMMKPAKEETFNVAEALASAPELAERVQRGQIWKLGRHRLMCGDGTNQHDVESLVEGGVVVLTLTDPPYAVEYRASFSKLERGTPLGNQAAYQEASSALAILVGFLSLCPSGMVVMTFPLDRHLFELSEALQRSGFISIRECVWVKDSPTFHPGAAYQQGHEPILVLRKEGIPYSRHLPPGTQTVFVSRSPVKHDDHPTTKPLELWDRLVEIHSSPGDIVYDPFLGVGTTVLSSQRLGRVCYAMEIEPMYCAVAIARWESFTGESAVML
jgi:DNA modification methylase